MIPYRDNLCQFVGIARKFEISAYPRPNRSSLENPPSSIHHVLGLSPVIGSVIPLADIRSNRNYDTY